MTCSKQGELMVTIRCLVYNHAPYLRECLNGFVMQKTNFRFEVIVHDDASTDGSTAIIREYAEKYPEIIKPIYQTENQYSKRNGAIRRIMNAHTRGKYVAMCEGDDYWIDPLKLQKQVDFLEENPEYTMCFAMASEKIENSNEEIRPFKEIENRDYTGLEVYKEWLVATSTIMCRRDIYQSELYKEIQENKNFVFGDITLILTCAHYGKLRGMNEIFSIYRRHAGGLTILTRGKKEFKERYAKHTYEIHKVFGKQYKKVSCFYCQSVYISLFLHSIADKNDKIEFRYLKESLKISIGGTLKAIMAAIQRRY